MRLIVCLFAMTLVGCSGSRTPLVFNIRVADVASASAEPLDRSKLSTDTNEPDFRAQIHIVFQEDGARRFHQFTEKHTGQLYELQVDGEVLLPAVHAQPSGGRDVWWFTTTMEQAQHFAASLTKR